MGSPSICGIFGVDFLFEQHAALPVLDLLIRLAELLLQPGQLFILKPRSPLPILAALGVLDLHPGLVDPLLSWVIFL